MPGSSDFSAFYLQVLSFIKFVMTSKLHITAWWHSLHPVDLSRKVLISFQTLKQPPWLSLGLFCETCFGSSEEKLVLMQSPASGLLIFLTSRYSLTFNSDRYSIVRSRLGIEVPSWSPLSVTVRTHPIKHFLDLFPLWSEWTKLKVSFWHYGFGSALVVTLVAADCNKVVFFGRRNPEACQHLHLLVL